MKDGERIYRWRESVARLHALVAGEKTLPARMHRIAEIWRGHPYIANSLVGGPQELEQLVVNLEAFDCVTFIESVLALARSRSFAGFIDELKNLRYRDGQVDWRRRLHYFHDWMNFNHRRGAIKICTRGAGSRSITARPGFIPELPRRTVRFHVVPKQNIRRARNRIPDGSIVAFASVRASLDFFHTGLLFERDGFWLYHASRSRRKVVAEPLEKFLARNRLRGIAFAEPLEPGRR